MVKSLIVLINFFVFALLNAFVFQRIEVEHSVPEQLAPGTSQEVSITINKGKVEGFAKLQINVDEGLVVENIESMGASFTFKDQKAKFIWMSLPEEKTFTVRYRLTATPDAVGELTVKGHFSYIDENQRLVHDLAPKSVQTGIGSAAVTANGPIDNTAASAVVSRTIGPLEDGRYRVTLNVEKSSLEGFAKLQEIISRDFTAVAVSTADAVFNIVDNKVKFVWFDIPSDEALTLAYDLIPVTANPEANFSIDGEFSFLVDNETQTVIVNAPPIEPQPAAEEPEPMAAEPEPTEVELASENTEMEQPADTAVTGEPALTSDASETEEKETVEMVIAEEAGERDWESGELENQEAEKTDQANETTELTVEEEPAEDAEIIEAPEETTTENVESPPVEEAGIAEATSVQGAISYRVQITAAHKLVDARYFADRHKFSGPFTVENHEGWVKYTTGGFEIYRAARDHRDALISNYDFPGPFVAAYNEGERITVQEALMIANQKWVP